MFSLLSSLLLATAVLATPLARQVATRQYTVYNKCPSAIDLYIGGVKDSSIPTNGNVVKTLGVGAGFFYTDANGGSPNAVGTIRAGFNDDFYYMVADPNHANTGLQVKPKGRTANNGFCETIECDGRGCPQAFPQPPTRFPAPAPSPPSPPYYRCPIANTDYDITFCPTGKFPDQGQPIHFNYFQNKCLDVRGAVFANGTPVQIYDCNGTQAQRWIIKRGSTKVQIAGTNFCLDAGTFPSNGIQLKIWQCYDNLPAQQWYYTDDNRIALENQGFCTDLESGIMTNSHKVQTWQCTNNNSNQVWTL
jgi:hypothetical protein